MADSSDDEEACATSLSAKECDALCKQFSEVTSGNAIEAMMYLQNSGWVIERAISAYLGDNDSGTLALRKRSEDNNLLEAPVAKKILLDASSTSTVSSTTSTSTVSAFGSATDKMNRPDRIRLLSWNLDGLDTNNLKTRTTGAIKEMKQIDPDVIFLQEVVPPSWDMITEAFSTVSYTHFQADTSGYFTVMLLKKASVWCDQTEVQPFYSSVMSRKLQIADVNIKGSKFKLLTSHLESTASHASERINQLTKIFNIIGQTSSDTNVLFGGDLNLRDKELQGVKFPNHMVDVWQATGMRKEAKFTWDTQRNDNLDMHLKFKPQCRFDRMYFRPSDEKNITPLYFELAGIQRVSQCSRFASDHWGILCHFAIKPL